MSRKRHTAEACPRLPSPVSTLTYDFEDGHVIPLHFHPEDQLVYASQGVMTIQTEQGTWVVPPQRAVWIPARIPHTIAMSGAVSMRTLYLKPRLVRSLPRTCCVVNVSPLLRELILHACTFKVLRRRTRIQAHLLDLLLDQMEAVQSVPLQLPRPLDSRALRVSETLLRDPGDARSLGELCRAAGASKRTIERLFQDETKLTFGKWRQQLRLMRSLQLLAAGEKVAYAALECGYSTPSAYIAMFRKVLGTTPGNYFSARVKI